jgi:hypothetical protein
VFVSSWRSRASDGATRYLTLYPRVARDATRGSFFQSPTTVATSRSHLIALSFSHLRTSRLRSSEGASEGARANGPSEVDDRGEKLSDDRGEKLVDDRGVCPVPRAEK